MMLIWLLEVYLKGMVVVVVVTMRAKKKGDGAGMMANQWSSGVGSKRKEKRFRIRIEKAALVSGNNRHQTTHNITSERTKGDTSEVKKTRRARRQRKARVGESYVRHKRTEMRSRLGPSTRGLDE